MSQAFANEVLRRRASAGGAKGDGSPMVGGANIINIGSIMGQRSMEWSTEYATSKGAVAHMTRQLSLELARHKIRVNSIAPGFFKTEINEVLFREGNKAGKRILRNIGLRRLGQLPELRGALLLLASDAGAFITGSCITVDGGHVVSSL